MGSLCTGVLLGMGCQQRTTSTRQEHVLYPMNLIRGIPLGAQGIVAGWGQGAREMGLCGHPKMHPGRTAEYLRLWGNTLCSSGTWDGQELGVLIPSKVWGKL